jgi:type I restriction enzyme S subunit
MPDYCGVEVKPGYKQTEVGVIPKEWEMKRLGDVASVSKGTQLHSSEANEGGKFAHLNGGITPSSYTNKSNTAGNTIAISEGGNSCGFVQFMQEPYWCGGHCYSVIPNGADNHFLYQALKGQQSAIMALRVGSGLPNVQKKGLLDFKISIPETLPEQRAIAEALSDVDALLDGLDQLIAKKRNLKQATMQQLLTGQTRLPGFHGEWEVRRLGDSVQIEKGQLITRKTLLPGEIPVIAGGKEPAYHHAVANRTGRTITVSASGANAGYVALYNEPIFASDCSTISESERYCLDFVYYHLLHLQQDIYELQTGGAQPHIHANDLKPIPFPFPNLIEQTAIAGVLSDLDAEVDALEARREKTQALKQGMMQELLTGKIRLLQPEVLHA